MRLRAIALLFILCGSAAAQKTAVPPASQQAGAPAGTYPLSGFESVNLFNGNLNFHLPLATVGGRGPVRIPITLQTDNVGSWSIWRLGSPGDPQDRSARPYAVTALDTAIVTLQGNTESGELWSASGVADVEVKWHGQLEAGPTPEPTPTPLGPWHVEGGRLGPTPYSYDPGGLTGRTVYTGGRWNETSPRLSVPGWSLTRLVFTWAGNQYELRDIRTGGQAHKGATWNEVYSRGRVFVSVDGSSATFVSDAEVTEQFDYSSGYGTFIVPSGFLLLADGTRFRVEEGRVSWVRDRQGNLTTFSYEPNYLAPFDYESGHGPSGRLLAVRDSLGRETRILYKGMADPDTGAVLDHDEVRFEGAGGRPRALKVWRGALSSLLLTGTTKTVRQLFSAWELEDNDEEHNPGDLVSAVELPDGRAYRFEYNQYGELARLTLPTGGKIEYDYLTYGNSVGVYRVVRERRVFRAASDAAPELRQVYKYDLSLASLELPAVRGGSATQTVDVEQRDGATDRLLTFERHHFQGNIAVANWGLYTSWLEGKELWTETYDTDGANPTNLLRWVEYTWRPRLSPGWYTGERDTGPAFDPRVVETKTTLENGLVSRRTSADPQSTDPQNPFVGFDRFNNPTDLWEYDFHLPGQPETLLRHTRTTYRDDGAYTGGLGDVGTSPGALAIQNLLDSPHLRGLPAQKSVFDAGGVERARTSFEYDNYTPGSTGDNRHAALLAYSDIRGLCLTPAAAGGCARASDDSYTTRGNVTGTTGYLLDENGNVTGSVTSNSLYDVAGNVVKAVDARGYATEFFFDDNFGAPNASARDAAAPAALQGKQTYAFVTKATNALGHTARNQYDYSTGSVVNYEDANGTVTSLAYGQNDPLDRLTQVVRAANYPNDSTLRSQTAYSYDDTNRKVTTTSDLRAYGDNLLKAESLYDGLGRVTEARQYEDAAHYVATLARYDGLGRVAAASNPYRPLAQPAESTVWTTTEYDALGRALKVTTPDGSKVVTHFDGMRTLVTDQDDKQRLSVSDALGRLVEVWEVRATDAATGTEAVAFPHHEDVPDVAAGYKTVYAYDVLGNLRKVEQGAQRRYFAYDSLSRLLRAKNPEQESLAALQLPPGLISPLSDNNNDWSLKYEYDENGNLKKRVDARGVETNYAYDALNRLTDRTYTDVPLPQGSAVSTPPVRYYYDTQTLPDGAPAFARGKSLGRLVAVTYGSPASVIGSYTGDYDALGRARYSAQVTAQPDASEQTYAFGYEYHLDGSLKSERYPSGRAVESEYDAAGRLAGMKRQGGDYYAGGDPTGAPGSNAISYTAHGAVAALRLGNGLWEHTLYNSRLQPEEIGLGTSRTDSSVLKLEYGYSPAVGGTPYPQRNNGNVQSQRISVPALDAQTPAQTFTQTYTYDALSRLETAVEVNVAGQTWAEGYAYDRFGNRSLIEPQTKRLNSQGQLVPAVDDTNRAALNPAISPATNRVAQAGYAYDAAGNLLCDPQHCAPAAAPTPFYVYDGESKMVGAGGSEYAYDGDGQRVKKVVGAITTVFVYDAAGKLAAEYGDEPRPAQTSYTSYITQDALGSTRAVTGRLQEVRGRHDYLPFGEELSAGAGARTTTQGYGAADDVRQQFTGYERDVETGLDYAQARYYASWQGRFTSADPLASSARPAAPQTFNRYTYALNSPLRLTDPSGMKPNDPGQEQNAPPPPPTGQIPPAPHFQFRTVLVDPAVVPGSEVNVAPAANAVLDATAAGAYGNAIKAMSAYQSLLDHPGQSHAVSFSVGVGLAASGLSGTLAVGESTTYHSTDEVLAAWQDANRQLAISANVLIENIESPVAGEPRPVKLGDAKSAFGGSPMSAALAREAVTIGFEAGRGRYEGTLEMKAPDVFQERQDVRQGTLGVTPVFYTVKPKIFGGP